MICFDEEDKCITKGYDYTNVETKECFNSKEDCFERGYKIFNKECYDDCPLNSEDINNNSICECSYYFYNDNGNLNCFNQSKLCEDEGYLKKSFEYKECFKSYEDCLSKDYFFYYNLTCFKNNCTQDKVPLGSLVDIQIKRELMNQLNLLDSSITDGLCICDTFYNKAYYGWMNSNLSPSLQICLSECPEGYEFDEITHRCYLCDPKNDYFFNNKCFHDGCPEKTKLNNSNPNSRICVCEELSLINNETGLITCVDREYPPEFFSDFDSCPFIYRGDCHLECPENTCISQKEEELRKCIDIQKNMRVFNNICFEEFEEILKTIENMEPINNPAGFTINGYYSEENEDELIKKYSNLTYIYLDKNNSETLRNAYNFPPDTKFYILVIDSPNFNRSFPINKYNFEIYLENGTQLKDLSSLYDSKILVSSSIIYPEIINYIKGKQFYEMGYDIYNRSDSFYTDNCVPASDEGNDITLSDRVKYYFPSNVSLCNEGCEYRRVDFENERMICECSINPNLNNSNKKEMEEEIEESYLDYFLSFVNYKIFGCYDLLFNFSNFYYNAGFYISSSTLLICLGFMLLFWVVAIKAIKITFLKNIPTKEKLKELLKKQMLNKSESQNNNSNRNSHKMTPESPLYHSNFFPPNKKNKTSIINNNEELNKIEIDSSVKNTDDYYNNKANEVKRKSVQQFSQKIIKRDSSDLDLILENKNSDFASRGVKEKRKKKLRGTKKKMTYNSRVNKHKLFSFINRDNEYSNQSNSNHSNQPNNISETDLQIDFNFDHLINMNDNEIEGNELNDIPFRQALRIDKRSFPEIIVSVFIKEIEILSLYFYRNPYSHFSLILSIYLLESLLDLTMNFILYSDDVVSQKYHNDGRLSIITSLTL